MLLSLAGTSLAVIGDRQAPSAPAFSTLFPSTTTPRPVEPTATVRTVSAVDQFEGVGTVSGDPIKVRVIGIRSTTDCWQAEALAFARDALQDAKVRLVLDVDERTPDGRFPAQVELPEGQDFALAALAAGAALADTTEDDPELLEAEVDARANRRGLWANPCASTQTPPPTTEVTSSTTTPKPSQQPSATTVPTSTTAAPSTSTTTTTTTTTPPPSEVQRGVKVGKPCSPQGAVGVTNDGRELTCGRTLVRGLRWAAR